MKKCIALQLAACILALTFCQKPLSSIQAQEQKADEVPSISIEASKSQSKKNKTQSSALEKQEKIINQLIKEDVPIDLYDPKDDSLINFDPIYPASYENGQAPTFSTKGKKMGHPANTLIVSEVTFPFIPAYGNTGTSKNGDAEALEQLLKNDVPFAVGQNNIHTLFGHYDHTGGRMAFNPLADDGLLYEGGTVILTDQDGYSKGYEITQMVFVDRPNQYRYFYNKMSLPYLAFHGNGQDMIFIQFCREDIQLGLLSINFGYRIW